MQRLIIIWALEGGGQDNPGNRGKSAKWESNTPPQMRHQISHNQLTIVTIGLAPRILALNLYRRSLETAAVTTTPGQNTYI